MGLAETLTHQVLRVHQRLYVASGGRIGHGWLGVPTLLLRATGRRSGQIRTNALVYARAGEEYVLVASNGGADQHPAWLHNLRADSRVEIQVGRERHQGTARILDPQDDHFDALWKLADANKRGRYSGYQGKTSREIPLVVISTSAR